MNYVNVILSDLLPDKDIIYATSTRGLIGKKIYNNYKEKNYLFLPFNHQYTLYL